MTKALRYYVAVLLVSLVGGALTAHAGLELIENFQDIPLGPLNGQRGWTATWAKVKVDPENSSNKVASFDGGPFRDTLPDGANLPLSIPEGTTATLFFR